MQDVANLDTGLASVPKGNRGQRNDERYDRRAMRSGENSKGFITVAKAHGTKTFLSRCFLDIRHSRPWRSPVGTLVLKRDSSGNSNLTNGVEWLAEHGREVRMEPGEARIRKRHWRHDATNSVLCMRQLVWLGATVSSDSLLWSRMSHLYCRWG